MMRSPKSLVVAVRRPDRSIAIREQAWESLWPRLKFLRWPFFRGALVLAESLHNGYSALAFSAEQADPASAAAPSPGAERKGSAQGGSVGVLVAASALMVLLFIATPHLLTYGLGLLWPGGLGVRSPLFHLVDGFLRVAILIGYIAAISRAPEMRRVFEYHGAEHKAIWTYESHQPLTVDAAQRFTTLHPRCGTSFLFLVVFAAVLLHAALLPLLPPLHTSALLQQLFFVAVKIPLALPVAGLAYELQRVSARPSCPRPVLWLTRPGLWLQRITTREPSADQLEIALLALERALAREEGRPAAAQGLQVYPSFEVARAA